MADNDWSVVVPFLAIQGIKIFREFAVMPQLVNSDYSSVAAEQGDTINVNISPPVGVTDVTPSATPYDAAALTATKVPIALDTWKQAPFKMTDKEMKEVTNATLPGVARNAVIALAEYVNADLLSLYKQVPTSGGTPGSTPFSGSPKTTTDASQSRKRLNIQKAMLADRRLVLDPDAMANAIEIPSLQDTSASNDPNVVTNAIVGRKVGFDWYEDQSVQTHTAGSVGGALTCSGASAIGDESVLMADAGSTFDLKEGDRFTIAGDTTQYIVTADVLSATATAEVPISPALVVAVSGSEVVTLNTTDFVANLAFNKEAFAFANRPLMASAAPNANANISSVTDPQTGITMRLEVIRQNKQDLFAYDILYGIKCVYPELATLLYG